MYSEEDKEFLSSFLSTDRYFDIKGCKTPQDIEKRGKDAIRLIENDLRTTKNDLKRKKLYRQRKLLRVMMDNQSPVTEKTAGIKKRMGLPQKRCGMQYVIIDEAKKDPKGYWANALRWGIDVAKLIEKDEGIRELFLG